VAALTEAATDRVDMATAETSIVIAAMGVAALLTEAEAMDHQDQEPALAVAIRRAEEEATQEWAALHSVEAEAVHQE